MAIPLPSALTDFSKNALKNIEALDSIQQSIPNVQGTVQSNIVNAGTKSIVSQPGNIFAPVPGFVDESMQTFLGKIASPKSVSATTQQESFMKVFGTGVSTGAEVDNFLSENVRLEDLIPAQQIFQIVKNFGSHSFYTDPLQAYAHVTTASNDIGNLCREAETVISGIQANVTSLLSLQSTINYNQIVGMNAEFFGAAGAKANTALSLLNALNQTFTTNGKYDASQVASFCSAINDFTDFVMFANSKILQFELTRKTIEEGLTRLRQIGRDFPVIVDNVKNYVPAYVASTAFGKIFQAVQRRVLDQSGVDLGGIVRDLAALSDTPADERTKVLSTFAMAKTVQAIKAYICGMDPSGSVTDPGGEFAPLKSGYDTLTAVLSGNDTAPSWQNLENTVLPFTSAMQVGVTQNNAADLSAQAVALDAILTPLVALLSPICLATDTFRALFASETSLDPGRVPGAQNLLSDVGLDNARDVTLSSGFENLTDISLSDSTKSGQLAESVRAQIATLPDGNEKDQLTLLYEKLNARHRATVVSMDFQRREDIQTFIATDQAESDRQLVNKVVTTFSGLDPNQFDQVFV